MLDVLFNPDWKQIMQIEFNALVTNNTWSFVLLKDNMAFVSYKWIFRVKYNYDGTIQRYKVKLVMKGFQQTPSVDYFETFNSVVKLTIIRVIWVLQ